MPPGCTRRNLPASPISDRHRALGQGFVLLAFGDEARAEPVSVGRAGATPRVVGRDLIGTQGLVAQRDLSDAEAAPMNAKLVLTLCRPRPAD